MKFSGKYLISTFLLIALAWMWNCDLRASIGFFCPDHSRVSMADGETPTSSHQVESQLPDCHKVNSEKEKPTNHSECSYCLELEWETANHYFPDTNLYTETVSWIVLNEIFPLHSMKIEINHSLKNLTIIYKNSHLDSEQTVLESNLRLRI